MSIFIVFPSHFLSFCNMLSLFLRLADGSFEASDEEESVSKSGERKQQYAHYQALTNKMCVNPPPPIARRIFSHYFCTTNQCISVSKSHHATLPHTSLHGGSTCGRKAKTCHFNRF